MSRALIPRLGAAAFAAVALAACGSPPRPLPTAPPALPTGSAASGSTLPSYGVPTMPGLPTGGLPPGGLPTGLPTGLPAPPVYPPTTRPVTTPPTTPRAPSPPPAGVCRSGPSGAQVLAVVRGTPGIPDEELAVHAGPFCAGTWQFAELELKGKDADEVEPLLVVTTGKPDALTVVEAGADVCSDRVQRDAPPGIRVWACGF